jgi:hypothetical protein
LKKLSFKTDISELGDMNMKRIYEGFKSLLGPLTEVPGEIKLGLDVGHIGAVRAKTRTEPAPHLSVRHIEDWTAEKIKCNLVFDGSVLAPNEPIDFEVDLVGLNAFATNSEEFAQLYPDDLAQLEQVVCTVPSGMAIEELDLCVSFGSADIFPKNAHLTRVSGSDGEAWKPCSQILETNSDARSFSVKIRHPASGARYRIAWPVIDVSSSKSRAVAGKARQAIELLTQASDAMRGTLSAMLPTFAVVIAKGLKYPTGATPIHVALYGYNMAKHVLVAIATNYDSLDERRDWAYPYGRGLPGLAWKSKKISAFDRHDARLSGPEVYFRGNGEIATSDDDIPEGSAFAIPLLIPGEQIAFGVIQFSVDGWGGHFEAAYNENDSNDLLSTAQILFSDLLYNALVKTI